MNLGKNISNLLFSHDCVIVPDFGAFIAQKSPASVSGNQINPPTKRLGFNPSLYKSDGLLIQKIAHKEGLTYELAQEKINEQVSFWKVHLHKNNSLTLGDLGTLHLDENGKTTFEPTDKNYLLESFGLEAVKTVQVMTQTIESETNSNGVWWKVASVLPVILGGYLYFAKPKPVADYVNQQWSGFVMPLLDSNNKNTEVISTKIIEVTPKLEVAPKENETPEVVEVNLVKVHQVIAGSFRVLAEAENFENKLREQGFAKAKFTQKKGSYHYVAFETFETKEEAENYRKSIQLEHPDSWVLSIKD